MFKSHRYSLLVFFVLIQWFAVAQSTDSLRVNTPWNAGWIAAPGEGREYGVYYFRKTIDLTAKPSSFVVHVSADNRYKLYVNDSLVSLGPARGDLSFWNYETVDLSPFLRKGKNIVASMVFNEGQHLPEAQITFRTGFILQGNTAAEEILNTNSSWKAIKDKAYKPIPYFYFAASTGQLVNMNEAITGWSRPDFDDTGWPAADRLLEGKLKGSSDGFGWMLVPSSIPAMEMKYERIPLLRTIAGMEMPKGFPAKKVPVVIPANTTVTMLLDQTYLTNAYPTLIFSGGKEAAISLRYAESLYDNIAKYGMRKSNRNEVEGKDFSGREDSLISGGGSHQSFTPLNYRTYRYIQLRVHTKAEPLVINDMYGTFTGYPFKQTAVFNTSNNEIKNILDIGWRTCRLDAVETYMDCPYYEQLQYIGDTRIQAMVSYYYSGDDRLARNALNLMDRSRLPEGVTLSRYPTHGTQIIPTFSLWYIGMLHDYWMYRNDASFIAEKLTGTRAILDFFGKYQQPDGSLKNTPYWTFVDWASGKDWFVGSPPKSKNGSSAIIDMQLLWAYQWASEMEAAMGMRVYADIYRNKAEQLKQTIREKYWNEDKKLFSDTEEKELFSQHANALAILTGIVNEEDIAMVCNKMLTDDSLTQCTIYFKYYLHMALAKGGLGNNYMKWLDVWQNNIKMGLTTWAEVSDLANTRSDCHAWGSSPNIEFFRTVLGIDSDSPGFRKVRVQPHPGDLTNVSGEIPHPEGKVSVSYVLKNQKWDIKITLPGNTSGTFIWKGKRYDLKSGANAFVVNN
ncbi:MAG: alpha-L-rhamnosidase C-terminal domain-containing protein [Niabella sp.]